MQAVKRTVLGLEHLAKHCQRYSNYGKSLAKHRYTRCCSAQSYSSETLAPPQADTEIKNYSPHIQDIVDKISRLTLIEVADLNDLLKKTLKIQDAPVMAMGAPMMPAAAPAEEAEEKPEERKQTLFTVTLLKFTDAKKVALIKELKKLIPDMNLVQAKKFVESCPQPVKTDISQEEADKLKEAIVAVGGEVKIE